MKFWHYIGEFFLFRWLFGKFRESITKHDAHTECLGVSIDRDSEYLNGNLDEGIAPDNAITAIGDDFLIDDSDNYEDLDIFMRDNKGNNRSYQYNRDYDSGYNISHRHSSQNDWNSGSHSQSYDDFLDEQGDYDMMDDDF